MPSVEGGLVSCKVGCEVMYCNVGVELVSCNVGFVCGGDRCCSELIDV